MLNGIQMITWKGSILLSNHIKVWTLFFKKTEKSLTFLFQKVRDSVLRIGIFSEIQWSHLHMCDSQQMNKVNKEPFGTLRSVFSSFWPKNRKFSTFVYIILTDFNFTRKIVTFVCIILTDFHFTRKIVDIFYVLFQPVKVRNWELQVQFKVTGSTKDLHGDGFVIWYARDRMQGGPVFGSKDYFSGLAIVADTYSNHNGPHNVKFLSLNSLLFLLIFFFWVSA